MHKIVRPADAAKIANLAQNPKFGERCYIQYAGLYFCSMLQKL